MVFKPILLVGALILSAAFSFQPQQSTNQSSLDDKNGIVLTGSVVAQGKPLPGAVLTLWQGFSEPTPGSVIATAQTNATGSYSMNNVPPGNYFMMATAKGFVTGKENQTILNIRRVIVAGRNAVEPINFELIPEGVISGVVTDADGRPISKAPIVILPEGFPPGDIDPRYGRDLRTDEQGTFRITGIPPGRYRIAAGNESVSAATLFGRPGYRRVFYPDSPDQSNARLITISPGSQIADVNINLGQAVKTFTVRAKILDGAGMPVTDVGYSLDAYANGKRIGGTSTRDKSNARGEVTIQNVPPGEYSVRVPGASGMVPVGEIPARPNFFGQSQHFNVTDTDVTDVEVRVVKGASISGFVVIEGAADSDTLARLSEMRIVAMVKPRPGGANPILSTNIKVDGSFSFTGLMPGTLQFNFAAPRVGGPLPVRLIRVERDGVRLEQDPEIEAGEQLTGLRVVLGYAKSSIHGVVKLSGESLPQNVVGSVMILQNGLPLDGVSLDSHGEFILQHLAAGEYKLVVSARKEKEAAQWKIEKTVSLRDNKTLELTIDLTSSPSPSH